MNYFILEGKEAVPVESRTWGDWFETAERHVAFTEIDGLEISTVFLGLDHGHGFTNRPLLFETMVFNKGGDEDQYMTRCTTWEEAEEMHKKAIEWVKGGCKDVD